MSLHPGERGVCQLHGEYDEYCGPCALSKTMQLVSKIAAVASSPKMAAKLPYDPSLNQMRKTTNS